MKFSFALTIDELIFQAMEITIHSVRYKRILMKSRIFLSIGFLIIALGLSSLDELSTCYTSLVLGVISILVYPKVLQLNIRRNFRAYYKTPANKRFLEIQTWTLDDKKLGISQAGIKSELRWDVFETLCEYPHHYMLNLVSEQGLLFPKSVFKSKNQEKEALTFFKKIPKANPKK